MVVEIIERRVHIFPTLLLVFVVIEPAQLECFAAQVQVRVFREETRKV